MGVSGIISIIMIIVLYLLIHEKISINLAERSLFLGKFSAGLYLITLIFYFIYFVAKENLNLRYTILFNILLFLLSLVTSLIEKNLFYTILRVKARI